MNRRRSVGLVGVALMAWVVYQGPADAQVRDHHDAAHDVESTVQCLSGGPPGGQPCNRHLDGRDRGNRTADITTFHVAYGGGRLVLAFDTRGSIVGRSHRFAIANWYVQVPDQSSDDRFQLELSIQDRRITFSFIDPARDGSCDAATYQVGAKTGRYEVSVPASCLRRPRWVRIAGSLDVGVIRHHRDYRDFEDAPLTSRPLAGRHLDGFKRETARIYD